jgi:hypothetical protein
MWRKYARIVDDEIVQLYGQIMFCEQRLNVPEKISLVSNLIQQFPQKIKNDYEMLSYQQKYEELFSLIPSKRVGHRKHDFFDAIAIGLLDILVILCGLGLYHQWVETHLISSILIVIIQLPLPCGILWFIENKVIKKDPPPLNQG